MVELLKGPRERRAYYKKRRAYARIMVKIYRIAASGPGNLDTAAGASLTSPHFPKRLSL